MSFSGNGLKLAAAVLGSILVGATPALAQNHGGGHAGGGGGAHFGGGGGAHFGGGHAAAGAHFGGGGHFSGPAHVGGYGGVSRGYAASGYRGGGYHLGGYAGRPAYGYPGHYWHGYSTGRYWGGGYWRGGWWPRAYYGVGWSWFLPILPLAYSTYWWGGVPYYYANDVYYTWSPDYQGYVATDPPPVTNDTDSGSSTAPGDAAPQNSAPAPAQGAPAQIFMYPKNGQSAEQQAQDRSECEQWAQQQAGQNGPDYNRAMVACVEGRGYSAR